MSTVKPRKDSLVDFIKRFSQEDQQINFFLNLKWPNGFSCDKCDCHDYYLVKRKNVKNGYLLICKKCGHQHSLLANTIFQDSNLSLIKILIGLYVFFSSNNGVNGNQLANYMDVNVKTARKFSKKCRILMAESNNSKTLQNSFYEIDILEIGGHHTGKRGKGSENKQPTLLVLSTFEDNKYPQYIKLHTLPNYKGEPIESYLKEKCIFNASTVINCDGDRAFLRLEKLTQLENNVVDYTNENHKLRWLNTFAGNIQSNIYHLYRSVKKRDLPLFLAEQEWRTNHRYSGKNIMKKVMKYISMSKPITFKQIANSIRTYEKQFLLAK